MEDANPTTFLFPPSLPLPPSPPPSHLRGWLNVLWRISLSERLHGFDDVAGALFGDSVSCSIARMSTNRREGRGRGGYVRCELGGGGRVTNLSLVFRHMAIDRQLSTRSYYTFQNSGKTANGGGRYSKSCLFNLRHQRKPTSLRDTTPGRTTSRRGFVRRPKNRRRMGGQTDVTLLDRLLRDLRFLLRKIAINSSAGRRGEQTTHENQQAPENNNKEALIIAVSPSLCSHSRG